MSNRINYTLVQGVGTFRSVRIWHDEQGYVIDAERNDGTLSEQDWAFASFSDAEDALPLLYAALVHGVQLFAVPTPSRPGQDMAPFNWHVTIPIAGAVTDGTESIVWPSKRAGENFIREWMRNK
jgi:hypothetical protein